MSIRPPEGLCPPDQCIAMINKSMRVIVGEAITLARLGEDGDLIPMADKEARLYLGGLRYPSETGPGEKPAYDLWMKSSTKIYVKLVFKLDGSPLAPDEFNLFGGFSVQPAKGHRLVKPFLRHLRDIVCNGDRQLYRYVMKFLAFKIQHPGANAEVALVLISRMEGAGKSLLRRVLTLIFGDRHTGPCSDPLQLYPEKGTFNDYTRRWLLAFAEDISEVKGGAAARLRGYITEPVRTLNGKFKAVVHIPNCVTLIILSNSGTPIALGAGSRRYVVLRASEKKVGDFAYFGRIEDSMANGGASVLLRILMGMNIKGWHPRQIPSLTKEARDAQSESANSIIRWLEESCDMGGLLTASNGTIVVVPKHGFGDKVTCRMLYRTYIEWAKAVGAHPLLSSKRMGMTLADLLGDDRCQEKMRDPAGEAPLYTRGWDLPSAEEMALYFGAYFDAAQRDDLEDRLENLRREIASRPPEKIGKPHTANALEAGLMAAWPKKYHNRAMSYAVMKAEALKNKVFNEAFIAVYFAAKRSDAYGWALSDEEMAAAIRAFAGAVNGDRSFVLDPLTDELQLLVGPVKEPFDDVDLPVGVAMGLDGRWWDLVRRKKYEDRASSGPTIN